MLEQMIAFFVSWFTNPSVWGIGLAIIFGAVWLVGYWPPLFKKPWIWAIMIGSAFLSLIAVAFVQIPLQIWTGEGFNYYWSRETLMGWIFLVSILPILYSGLVQEGAKLVPIIIYWWRKGKNIDPRLGLAIGAVAGAGFGTFEAVWAHNSIFAAGWSWEMVQTGGILALAGFWERFFAVAFHTAASALAGWGLARGWGWQFYLLAAFLHASLNYSVVLLQSGVITMVQLEIFAAVWAVLVTGGALWLRWRKEPPAAPGEAETQQ